MVSSYGPQCFAAFAATMGEHQARLRKITHHQCLHQVSPPFPPSLSLAWIMSGNLVMGTSISWTSPALPLLKKGEGVGIFFGQMQK